MRSSRWIVLLALLALSGCQQEAAADRPSPPSPPPATSSPADFPRTEGAPVLGRVRVGAGACGVIVAAGRVWVSSAAEGTLVSVDPRTFKVLSRTPVGDTPCGLAYGDGSIWVENYGSYDVSRVDATTGRREATVDVGFSPYDVTFADHAAWVTNNGSASVSRIDARTNGESAVKTGGRPTGIAVAGGLVWVALGAPGLAAIDPATSKVVQRVRTDHATAWTAATGDRLWVTDGDTVDVVDASSGEITTTVPVPHAPADASAVGATAYVPQRHTGRVAVVRQGRVTRVLDVGVRDPFVVAAEGRTLWVADFGGSDLVAVRLPA